MTAGEFIAYTALNFVCGFIGLLVVVFLLMATKE